MSESLLWPTVEIRLGNSDFVALVDEIDWPRVRKYKWLLMKKDQRYVRAHHQSKSLLLHRIIMRAESGQVIDHINGDAIDNRRANLRFCTTAQNCWNRAPREGVSSGFKGVCKVGPRYVARIRVTGTVHNLGTFDTEIEAAEAYDEAALLLQGRFARLNVSAEVHDAHKIRGRNT